MLPYDTGASLRDEYEHVAIGRPLPVAGDGILTGSELAEFEEDFGVDVGPAFSSPTGPVDDPRPRPQDEGPSVLERIRDLFTGDGPTFLDTVRAQAAARPDSPSRALNAYLN
jgi:hypothetical protein